jgi:hypothetical protein
MDILPGLSVRRDAPVHQNGGLAGIIGSQDLGEISAEAAKQVSEVPNASGEILLRIEGVGNAVAGGCLRHKLHKPHGPFGGDGPGVKI